MNIAVVDDVSFTLASALIHMHQLIQSIPLIQLTYHNSAYMPMIGLQCSVGGIYAAFNGSYTDTHELCIQLLDAANATVNDCQLHAHAHTAREHKRRLYRSIKRTT
ncbi:hypothetical protein QVD99_008144 [Batrachochytrium dendrobatidis]|nr:hypothetical protein QVD99_008331 [Batrachochytrium dendrobatidis]KAK5665312.1 hypothetical protein QVD99_008144 [Batrachochytrium dendrobatidis]